MLLALLPPVARAGPGPAAAMPRRITVVFRLDDVSARSDTALEERLVRSFRRRGLRCTFGVIPRIAAESVYDPSPQDGIPLPPEKVAMLKDAIRDGTVEPAEHGLSHQVAPLHLGNALAALLTGHDSEFFGVARARQRRRIALGRSILERALGSPVVTFIPPWNEYDENTLAVLHDLGFRCLSAARVGASLPGSGLRLLPSTCGASHLILAVEAARKASDPSPVVVALLHPADFRKPGGPEGRLEMTSFDRILDWISAQKDVRVATLGGAAAILPDLGSRRFLWNRIAALRDRAVTLLRGKAWRGGRAAYLSTPCARISALRILLLPLAAGLALLLLSAGPARRRLRRRRPGPDL